MNTQRKKISHRTSLNKEEKELLKSFERGEWKSVKHPDKEKTIAKQAADYYLRKDVRINIRLPSNDLFRLKQKAAFEGLPYQTLIASVLHKYASGHL